MASNKKTPPSLSTIIVLGILSLALGKILAMASLATQSVTEVPEIPKEEEREVGAVYFIKGSEIGAAGWEVKRQALLSGSNQLVAFSEQELNQWSKRELVPAPVEGEEESGPSFFEVVASPPNFRISEEQLQLASYVEVPAFFPGKKFLVIIKGHFESASGGSKFVVDQGTVGKAPLGSIPILKGVLLKGVKSSFEDSEIYPSLAEALDGVSEIVIENNRLGFVRS